MAQVKAEDTMPTSIETYENGVARIKSEYVVPDHERKIALDCISEEDKKQLGNLEVGGEETSDHGDEAPCRKRIKLDGKQKRKLSGQNKARPIPYKLAREKHLCFSVSDVSVSGGEPGKCLRQNCQFLHDIQEYLSVKPKDIGPVCYIYSQQGRCQRGLTCRFGSHHLDSEGRNLLDTSISDKYQLDGLKTFNTLSKDLQISLRKRKFDFSKADAVIAQADKERKEKDDAKKALLSSESKTLVDVKTEATENVDVAAKTSDIHEVNVVEKLVDSEPSDIVPAVQVSTEEKRIGPVPDNDIIVTRQSEKIVIDWRDKLYLSPLTTVGNLPFRRICKEYGVDITCGEMAMASSLLRGLNQEWALVKRHQSEDLFGVQLCGNNPYVMTKCAQMMEECTDAKFIDINLGCPIELIYRRGEGSGLLNRDRMLGTVIQCMSRVINLPLTCKTRTGVQTNKNIAHQLAPKFRDWGASMMTVHGRSREQRYTKSANWPYIEECAAAAAPIPLFLNGDVLSYHDYERARRECPTVAGVMVGRGALIKPWIFTEIKERRDWDISSGERLDLLKRYVNYGLEHWGSDTKGVENTRRFLLEWLSFLHRYIPVGLLECPPQKINDRPPYYRGRDELETLMGSPNCADWIKISELLLGPLPEGYHFLPKHKANSWK